MVCVVDAGRKGVARRRPENGAKGARGVRRHADAGCQRAGRRRRPGGRGLGSRASERLESCCSVESTRSMPDSVESTRSMQD